MFFYARDIYPNEGKIDTTMTTIPNESEQRLLEVEQKAVEVVKEVKNVSSKGVGLTLITVVGIIFVLGFLQGGQ